MEEVKIPNGGLNLDDAPDFLSKTEYTESHNYRITGTDGEDSGHGTNVNGNTLIDFTLPAGLNSNIGVGVFKNIRKAYGVIYSSIGQHQILEFDYDTLSITSLFQDLLDTGGVQIFNILPSHYFNDIKLFREKYLVMTDGISGMIYCINLERLKSGGYATPITADDFNLLKPQPLIPIKAEYIDDAVKTANLVKGKLFQFRAQNEYLDLMKSAWSTISKRPVPETESTDSIGDDPRKINGILLKVNIGDDRVERINIAARADNFDWYQIKTVSRDYVLTLPTDINIATEIREAYNPTTNEYSFIFYNDGAYEPLPVLITDEPYDNIPQNAGTLEIVNGDILALGDITEGYDRPTGIDVQVSVSTYTVDLGTSITDPRNFTLDGANVAPSNWQHRRKVELNFHGVPKTGDVVKVVIDQLSGRPSTPQEIEYEVQPAENNNLDLFTTNFLNFLPNNIYGGNTKNKQYIGDAIRVNFITDPYFELKSTSIVWQETGNVQGITKNIVKSNTSYQLALFHYDKSGRFFPIVTGDNFVANTPSFSASEGQVPQIGWNIMNGAPPEGAVSYQWGISENTKYLNNLYVTGIYDATESQDDFIYLNLKSLETYTDSNNGIVAYQYSEGDRVVFINNFNTATQPIKWFNSPVIDFPVAGYEIKAAVDDQPTKYLLKIKKSDILDIADLTDKEVLIELYTPKKNNESLETKIFYEIGEQFPIINGHYSQTSGIITGADAYLRPRKFRSNVQDSNDVFAFPVEDFNFSDDYVSNYWSSGRGRTYQDEVGRVRRKASIRYSEPSAVGSLTNNLNKFYSTRIYGESAGETTSIYGAITKLIMRDNYLIALQELKVGHIPVNLSMWADAAEVATVALSDTLLNKVRYLTGNIGTGLAKRAITTSITGNVYFVDHNNGYPCRDGYNGLQIINTKATKYFHDKIKSAKPDEIVLIYDDFNNELNMVFIDLAGEIQVINFDVQQWESRDSYVKTTGQVTLIQPSHGTTSFVDGNIVYTPANGYSGQDSVTITFTEAGQVIIKNQCVTVIKGTTIVQPFSFTPQTGVALSTQIISNGIFVSGINVAVPISIVGGQYRINGGAWISSASTVVQGDFVEVRQLSSAVNNTTTTATLTISDKSAPFIVSTEEQEEVGNTLQSQSFQRNNCASGSSGTFYNYQVVANTYFAPTLTEANNLALADITANGQNAANTNGTCILNTVISTLVVDVNDDQTADCGLYIDTVGVSQSLNMVYTGNNFYQTGVPPENAFLLASDLISGTTKWRFEAGIGKLINLYPDATAIPQFIFKLRGRGQTAGTLNGNYALKFPNQTMTMTGTAGSYIPSVSPAGGPPITAWSGSIIDGADDTYGIGVGAVIKTFTYDRASNTIIVS